ncbi:hypothetical protein NST21_09735 [Peribacillus sp. FSL K6-1552]|uniref:hypothetical protein n=1 Tax=Peribacillus sp. FSL K6-1552 TaxID=2954514 RepID=UPI0030FB781D
MKKENRSSDEPTIAEGINTEDELKRDATKEEIDKGDYTKVTTLSLDENDPSKNTVSRGVFILDKKGVQDEVC